MATSADSVRRALGWVFPVSTLGVGLMLCAGVAFVLTETKARLPAMAAVDAVSLILPREDERPKPTGRRIASEWPEPGSWSGARIRGNVFGLDGEMGESPRPVATAALASLSLEPKAGESAPAPVAASIAEEHAEYASDPNIRWFNARPVRPARTVWMTVTGYSPDERSCGEFADGLTATLHSVTTNAMKLVAADPTVLPYGSMVSVPGYDAESIVPVLDCGGAIKGDKLDLLFPTHEEALTWGRQRILVTVWEYADGLPPENPRKVR